MSGVFDVVVAGHLCLDVIPDIADRFQSQFERTFLPGRTLDVGPLTFCTGGPVSNTGLALQKLGIQTRLIGKVGDDRLGQVIKDIIRSYGPHLSDGLVIDNASVTSYTIVISPPGVDRLFMHCQGANETFDADDVDYELVARARLFHLGYPPLLKRLYQQDGRQLREVFRRVKGSGVTTSLDLSLPNPLSEAGKADWRAILRATLPYVDIFLPSLEELLYMIRPKSYHDLVETAADGGRSSLISADLLTELSSELLEYGTKVVGIKVGEQGFFLRTADEPILAALGKARPSNWRSWATRMIWSPCFAVNVVGTTGAGDATIAGFLSAMLRDYSPEAAATAAVAVGACNVEALDALTGIRDWESTMQRVADGWNRLPLSVEQPGWRFDTHDQLWKADGSLRG